MLKQSLNRPWSVARLLSLARELRAFGVELKTVDDIIRAAAEVQIGTRNLP
jgi:hypothetical protein